MAHVTAVTVPEHQVSNWVGFDIGGAIGKTTKRILDDLHARIVIAIVVRLGGGIGITLDAIVLGFMEDGRNIFRRKVRRENLGGESMFILGRRIGRGIGLLPNQSGRFEHFEQVMGGPGGKVGHGKVGVGGQIGRGGRDNILGTVIITDRSCAAAIFVGVRSGGLPRKRNNC